MIIRVTRAELLAATALTLLAVVHASRAHAETATPLPEITVESAKPKPAPKPLAKPAAKPVARRVVAARPPVSRPVVSRPVAAVVAAPAPQPGPRPGSEAEAIQPAPILTRYDLPVTAASITAEKAQTQINVVDTEDVVKYLPSVFVRKRNNGDTQPVLATRTWGVNSSARSLVYADDLLLTALIANNNTIGAPRWGLVAPEEISRVDMLYGPFAAAYPGNAEGGVLLITTKMPEKAEATIKQTEAVQDFSRYGTKGAYVTSQTSATAGNRWGPLSLLLTFNYSDSYSQPLFFITATGAQTAALPAGTTGVYSALNKTGAVANVVGAGGLLHTEMTQAKLKLGLDLAPGVTASYLLGLWSNQGKSSVDSYLRTSAGAPTFGNISGFAGQTYGLEALHVAQALSVRSDTKGVFDFDVAVSRYDIAQDWQNSPYGVTSTGVGYSTRGKLAKLDGTNWTTGDAKGIWRPFGIQGAHEVSFGVHADQYVLVNPTLQLADWQTSSSTTGASYTDGRGRTQTDALWLQDAWKFAPAFKLTLGARYENWQAAGGYNLATSANSSGVISSTTAQNQPSLSADHVSPKAALAWEPNKDWLTTISYGNAARFPTVSELYQIVSTGATYSIPNPNLSPETVNSAELAVERRFGDGLVRVSLFNEVVDNALVSQTSLLNGGNYTFVSNVNRIRNRGIEVAAQKDDVLIEGLQLSGSVTYVDSRILSDPSWTGATSVVGKHVPYVPDWRASLVATYRPDAHWAFSLGGRYSGKQYSTLDNSDVVSNVFGAFDSFFVLDTRVQYSLDERTSFGLGVDNITDTKYVLYHPFPGRTFVVDARTKF